MLGLLSFAIANARAEFTTTIRLSPAFVSVPDAEHGTEQTVLGYLVLDGDREVGHVFHDGRLWCWRTIDGSRFGREGEQGAAMRAVVGTGR